MKKNKKTGKLTYYLIIAVCIMISVISVCITVILNNSNKKAQNDDSKANILTENSGTRILKSESAKYISYIVEDYERDLTYTWQFEKTDEFYASISDNLEIDLNLRLNIDTMTKTTKEINERVDQNKLIVIFEHHGKLPEVATIRINVAQKFEDGEKLYLYYYNEDSGNIEYIDNKLKVKDGYVEFQIDHCSDYFLTAAVVNDAVNNPKSINYIIIGLGVVVFILVAVTLKQSKR